MSHSSSFICQCRNRNSDVFVGVLMLPVRCHGKFSSAGRVLWWPRPLLSEGFPVPERRIQVLQQHTLGPLGGETPIQTPRPGEGETSTHYLLPSDWYHFPDLIRFYFVTLFLFAWFCIFRQDQNPWWRIPDKQRSFQKVAVRPKTFQMLTITPVTANFLI